MHESEFSECDWSLYGIDLNRGEVYLINEGFDQETATLIAVEWNWNDHTRIQNTVVIPWPEDKPLPSWMAMSLKKTEADSVLRASALEKIQQLENEINNL